MSHCAYHKGPGQDADNDGGDTVEQIRRVAYYGGERFILEFREIDSGDEANGNSDQRRHSHDLQAAHYGVGHTPAYFAGGLGQLCEEVPVQGFAAVYSRNARITNSE